MSSFGVSHFTFARFFSIIKNKFSKGFSFCLVQRKYEQMANKDFVLVTKWHFPLSVNNLDSLSHYIIWFILLLTTLLWKWENVNWEFSSVVYPRGFKHPHTPLCNQTKSQNRKKTNTRTRQLFTHIINAIVATLLSTLLLEGFYIQSFWYSLPAERFPLTCNLSGLKPRVNRHLWCLGSYSTDFLNVFQLFLFLLVTPCLAVPVHPSMKWIPMKKYIAYKKCWIIDLVCACVFRLKEQPQHFLTQPVQKKLKQN